MSDPRTLVGLGVSPGIAIGQAGDRGEPAAAGHAGAAVARTDRAPRSPGCEDGGKAGGQAPRSTWPRDATSTRRRGVRLDLRGTPPHARGPRAPRRGRAADPRRGRQRGVGARAGHAQAARAVPEARRRLPPGAADRCARRRRTAAARRSRGGRRRGSATAAELGILVADDIPPSQAIQLASRGSQRASPPRPAESPRTPRSSPSRSGSRPSSASRGSWRRSEKARLVIVDGFEGHVLVDPDPALIQVYSLRAEEHRRRQQEMLGLAHLPAKTLDGHAVTAARQHRPRARDRRGARPAARRASGCSAASSCSCRPAPPCPTRRSRRRPTPP